MSDLAIRIDGLGKKYRIGVREASYRTLRESIVGVTTAPVRRIASVIRGNPPTIADESFWALKNVTLDIKRGEVVGIIGRNGAGKTTLLKILARITKPTEGQVDLWGRVGSLLEVGTGFHPELTGRENISLNGAILGMTREEIKRKFDEIVKFAEIERFLDTPVKHYSSGMYVRLAFAVAAHYEPEILLVDEVLAVGDAAFQSKCLSKMSEVATEGRTVLFVSHSMGAIEDFCQRSILIEAGSIACMGETRTVVSRYMQSSKSAMDVPLGERRDRQGTGKLKISSIVVNDRRIRDRVLYIDLSILNTTEVAFENVLLSVTIRDFLGKQISNLVNLNIDRSIPISIDVSRVRLGIRNINLVPGTYHIGVFISADKLNSEIFDWVIDAAKFEVPDYDFYRKGHTPYIKGQTIYMDYDFENLRENR